MPKRMTNDERKTLCSIKHGNKYDYSKSDFTKVKEKTTVICPEHGEFLIDFDHHYNSGVGCKCCAFPVRDTESFKLKASEKHNGYYNYDKSIYVDSHSKLIITCPVHGDFLQVPNAHLRGEGCPKCNKTSVLEKKIGILLKENNIYFIQGKRAKWLITESGGHSHLDFFIPEINLAIECQGKQHFGFGGWSDKFDYEERKRIDLWKKQKCDEQNVNLVYFSNKNETPSEYIGKVFTDESELLKYIKYLFTRK